MARCFPGPRERWGWRGKSGFAGTLLHGAEAQRRRRKPGGSRFGGEKGQSPSAPLIAASAAKERVRDGSRMAETPLFRRLGATPESPAPKGRRPVLSNPARYQSHTLSRYGFITAVSPQRSPERTHLRSLELTQPVRMTLCSGVRISCYPSCFQAMIPFRLQEPSLGPGPCSAGHGVNGRATTIPGFGPGMAAGPRAQAWRASVIEGRLMRCQAWNRWGPSPPRRDGRRITTPRSPADSPWSRDAANLLRLSPPGRGCVRTGRRCGW